MEINKKQNFIRGVLYGLIAIPVFYIGLWIINSINYADRYENAFTLLIFTFVAFPAFYILLTIISLLVKKFRYYGLGLLCLGFVYAILLAFLDKIGGKIIW